VSHLLRAVMALVVVNGLGPQRRIWAILVSIALWMPVAAFAAATGCAMWRLKVRLRRSRRETAAVHQELSVMGDVLGIALTSGMSLQQALEFVARELSSDLRNELEALVRAISHGGSLPALASAGGAGGRLYVLLGRAMATGAPVLASVERFVDEVRADERARRQAAVRRLPVLLLIPLALLILPGFVLLVIAPAFLGALDGVGL
jgi:type II secretory pathway component PulF